MNEENATDLFLGLDISTQQVKAILIDSKLKIIYEDQVSFDQDLPEFKTSGGAHIHDDKLTVTSPTIMWVKAMDKILDKMKASGVKIGNIAAISGAGQQHGSVYWALGSRETLNNMLSEKTMFEQLRNSFSVQDSPIWMDSSTTKQCRRLEDLGGGPGEIAKITGSRAYERFTGNQIAKIYQENEVQFRKTEQISLVSSFGSSLFIGDFAPIDYSDGSGMNLMDIEKKHWHDKYMDFSAPDLNKLLLKPMPSDTVVGKVSNYMIERYGFDPNCDVVAFTGDNPASLAGMCLKKGEIIVSLGTSDTLFLWLTEPKPAIEGHIFVNPVDTSAYMALLCYKNGSLVRENIRNIHASGSWDTFEECLKTTPKGNNGNIGIYYDIAEITPLNACGTFRFDSQNKEVKIFSPKEEIRALIEGQFIAKRLHAEQLGFSVADGNSNILVTGGASSNPSILQVIADVFNSSVYVLDVPNSAALGGAYRAKHGREKIVNPEQTFQESVKNAPEYNFAAKPDLSAKEIYDEMVKRYKYLEDKFVRT